MGCLVTLVMLYCTVVRVISGTQNMSYIIHNSWTFPFYHYHFVSKDWKLGFEINRASSLSCILHKMYNKNKNIQVLLSDITLYEKKYIYIYIVGR